MSIRHGLARRPTASFFVLAYAMGTTYAVMSLSLTGTLVVVVAALVYVTRGRLGLDTPPERAASGSAPVQRQPAAVAS